MRSGIIGLGLCEGIKKDGLSTDKLKEAVSKITNHF